MSFTAEWTPTTGFNTSGYTVKFGKQLNQCVVDEIVAHPMCGSNHPLANCAYIAKDANLGYSSVAMHLANAQFKEPIPNGQSNTWVCSPAQTGDNALVYRRTIFVGMPTSVTAPQYCLTDQCDNRILIIEDIKNPNKLVYNYGNITWNVGATANYKTMANQVKHTCNRGQSAWSSAPSTVTYIDTSDPDNPQTTIYKICMYHVYTIGTDCFIIGWDYIGQFGGRYQNASNEYNCLSGGSNYNSFVSANGNDLFIGLNINHTGAETNLQGIMGNDIYPNPVPDPATFAGTNIDYAPQNIVLHNVKLRFTMSNSTIGSNMRSCFLNFSLYDTEEIRKQQFARSGVYFVVNGELFKPIISGGIVIGYGTPEQESEIDDYTDLNHPVPSGGGGGGGGGDDDDLDPMDTGFASTLSGCTKYYLMSPQDVNDLIVDFYTNAFAGSTLSQSIISCYLCGAEPTEFLSTDGGKIKIPTVSGQAMFESTRADYQLIDAVLNEIPMGSIDVPRLNGDFHDFSPYSIYEVFLPFCGWCSLPDTVAGRTIVARLEVDIRTMAGKGIIMMADDDGDYATVAEMCANIGASAPFAVIEAGLERQAAVTAGIQTAVGVAQGLNGAVSGHNSLTISGFGNAIQGVANGMMSSMANYTQVQGKAGDTSDFANGRQPYLKISWAKTDDIVNSTQFAHAFGYVCDTVGTLGNFSGFTVVSNPHIKINATQAEREEIKRLLEEGVVL